MVLRRLLFAVRRKSKENSEPYLRLTILLSGFLTKGNEWSCTQIQTEQLPGDASVTVAFANPISVAWQSSDLDNFVPKSAPLLALANQTGGILSSASSTATSAASTTARTTRYGAPTSSSTSGSDLSTGAKAGIGVGAGVAGLAIVVGIIYWVFRCYKLTQKSPKTESWTAAEKRDIYGENMQSPVAARGPAELHADDRIFEANTEGPVEAPTKSSPQELEGDGVPELPQDGSQRVFRKTGSGRR